MLLSLADFHWLQENFDLEKLEDEQLEAGLKEDAEDWSWFESARKTIYDTVGAVSVTLLWFFRLREGLGSIDSGRTLTYGLSMAQVLVSYSNDIVSAVTNWKQPLKAVWIV